MKYNDNAMSDYTMRNVFNHRLPILLPAFFLLPFFSPAQLRVAPKRASPDSAMMKKDSAYLDRQDHAFLEEIAATLEKRPPGVPINRERELALLLLDAVMHDPRAAFRRPVQDFFHYRMEKAIGEMEHTRVDKGARIWKLYNMCFIVRTRSVTMAFDLTSAGSSESAGFMLPEAMASRLVDQCDVLFISHYHDDHADKEIAARFIAKGKPVVAPPQIWAGDPIHARITHLERNADLLQALPVKNGREVLKIVLFPGHQMRKIENNVPLVFTPEGLSFCHMGDQINEGDFMPDYQWIDSVGKRYHVDVLMPPCWTNELFRIVKGFNPALVLPGHENELGHPVNDRVPFWGDSEFLELTYPALKRSEYPVIITAWGESVHYIPN